MSIDEPVVLGSVNLSGNDYPVFGSQSRAVEYLRGSVSGASFTELGSSDQRRNLITSKRWLDRQPWKSGFPVPDDGLVPLGIEFAQYELCLVLISDPESFNKSSTASREKRLRAGSVEIEFFNETSDGVVSSSGVFPAQALDLLRPYLASRSAIIAPTVGGLGNTSNVLGVDQFGLSEPL